MSIQTHIIFHEAYQYERHCIDWEAAQSQADMELGAFLATLSDDQVLMTTRYDKPIRGSSIADQYSSGGGVGYKITYRLRAQEVKK